MQYLPALPRSGAEMGFYATDAERTPIATVRLASDIPAAQRPHFEYRPADNPRFGLAIAKRDTPDPPMVAIGADVFDGRSGDLLVGKEDVSTFRSRWATYQ